MDNFNSRRISAPNAKTSSSLSFETLSIPPYHSLRLEKRHHKITKEPNVSTILENDSEIINEEDKSKLENIIKNKSKLYRNHSHNNNNGNNNNSVNGNLHKEHNNKEKFDVYDRTKRQFSNESGRSLSCNSLNSNNTNDHHSLSSSLSNNYQIHHDNKAFSSSTINIHESSISTQDTIVIREQYWSCPRCCCINWTRREKILIWTVASLIIIIFILFGAVGFLIDKNDHKNDNILFSLWKL